MCLLFVELVEENAWYARADLRPELNAFDPDLSVPGTTHAKMYTPNIDALARQSLVLRKNYCQQAICGPTRASLLTSRRPDRTRVWDLSSYWRTVGGNYTTIPQLFRQHGYETVGMVCTHHLLMTAPTQLLQQQTI